MSKNNKSSYLLMDFLGLPDDTELPITFEVVLNPLPEDSGSCTDTLDVDDLETFLEKLKILGGNLVPNPLNYVRLNLTHNGDYSVARVHICR